MNSHNITLLLNDICDLIIKNMDRINESRYEVTLKSDGTPITTSDIYIENLIFEFVKKRIPNLTFIGEESFNEQMKITDNYIVILDPIDGTENFCSGMKEWGVSFGIWEGTRFLGSFLLLPELGLRIVSGEKIQPIKKSRITGLSSKITDPVINLLSDLGEYRIMGCAVYNIFNVINGSYKRFVNPEGARVWDILPGVMLALESGCKVQINGKEYNGEFLNPKGKYCVDIFR